MPEALPRRASWTIFFTAFLISFSWARNFRVTQPMPRAVVRRRHSENSVPPASEQILNRWEGAIRFCPCWRDIYDGQERIFLRVVSENITGFKFVNPTM